MDLNNFKKTNIGRYFDDIFKFNESYIESYKIPFKSHILMLNQKTIGNKLCFDRIRILSEIDESNSNNTYAINDKYSSSLDIQFDNDFITYSLNYIYDKNKFNSISISHNKKEKRMLLNYHKGNHNDSNPPTIIKNISIPILNSSIKYDLIKSLDVKLDDKFVKIIIMIFNVFQNEDNNVNAINMIYSVFEKFISLSQNEKRAIFLFDLF